MAIYTYRCRECDAREEVVQSISSYCHEPHIPRCDQCSIDMERYLTPPLVSFDHAPWSAFKSPIDGSVITGKREQREHMIRHDVALYDDIKPDIERAAKAKKQEALAGVRNDIIESVKMLDAGYRPVVHKEIIPAE